MNNNNWLTPGSISVISGCMFAGKTNELIRRVQVLRAAGQKVLVFKPKIDNRYQGQREIISHDNLRLTSYSIKTVTDMKCVLNTQLNATAIAIDETQFLNKRFLLFIKQLAKEKKIIICAGVDKAYWNQYHSLMSALLVEADFITKLFTVCRHCNNQIATYTQRLKEERPVTYFYPKVVIGSQNRYEPRCRFCFVDFSK